ncbi:hypothetical protein HAX54_038297, partial [Datura stramonium]|nr:hypothetical protein [Datura stramonium]
APCHIQCIVSGHDRRASTNSRVEIEREANALPWKIKGCKPGPRALSKPCSQAIFSSLNVDLESLSQQPSTTDVEFKGVIHMLIRLVIAQSQRE